MPSLALLTGSLRLLIKTKRSVALLGLQVAPALLFLFAANGRTDASAESAFIDVSMVALFGESMDPSAHPTMTKAMMKTKILVRYEVNFCGCRNKSNIPADLVKSRP